MRKVEGDGFVSMLLSSRCVACTVLIVSLLQFGSTAKAQEAERAAPEALEAAVLLFQEGDFVGAQHALGQIAPAKLNEKDRRRHAEYLQRAALAVSMFDKAEGDHEAAGLAISEGRLDDARRLLRSVVDNKYTGTSTRTSATQQLEMLDRRGVGAQENRAKEPSRPAPAAHSMSADAAAQLRGLRAKVLTREGTEAMSAGRVSEARRLFSKALGQVAGYPEAVQGLERLGRHELVESGAQTLIDRIRDRHAVAWQRTVATYRSAEREVRDQVLGSRFDQATQAVLRARQIVEGGKAFADPVARYEALRHDVEALARYVEDEQRHYHESEVSRQREQARSQNAERVERARRSKQERINELMGQALQHRKDRDYSGAINVLHQVLAIDRTNDNARWMKENLEDIQSYAAQRETRQEFYKQSQAVFQDLEESKVPWWQELTFPKNWLEIIERPTRTPPGSETRGIDRDLQSRLDRKFRFDFNNEPLREVMQKLADAGEANISVAWNDLASASIKPDTPVTLKFAHPVRLGVALREVLDQVGGSRVELGFLPTDGIVKVATRDLLDRNVYLEVYDVHDLLIPIPDFNDAPNMDLRESIMFAAYGRSLPGTAGGQGPFFSPNLDDRELAEEIMQEHANELVSLIRETIDPKSWRTGGGDIGSITEINGQLVITQTPSGQARIGGLLSKLREQRAIQVALEARFLTVQSNYLEEMGLDLDIILNSGNAGFDFIPGAGGTPVLDPILGTRLLLPRSFSRLGFTPGTPGVGNTIVAGPAIAQPFNAPGLVPAPGNNFIGGGNSTPLPIINNVLQFTDPGRLTSDLPGSFAGNPTLQPALSIFGSFLDNIQVDFLIRATQADSRTSLLTAPRLVLFNGQRAWVAVVNQQSFVSSLQPVVDAQGQAPAISTIETGAVLDAQATVSADKRYVTMTLRPSIGRLLGIQTFGFSVGQDTGLFVQLPNITRTVVRTTVSVPDGGTLLIGGQKLAGEIEVESGVPILSKIPILKRFYSSRTLVKDEQVLLILIKPKIIIQSEAEQIAFPTFSRS